MSNLIKNELIKIYAKIGWVLVAIVFVAGIVMAPLSTGIIESNNGAFYVYNLAGTLALVNLFTIIVSSTIFNIEISSGTIKFLLLRSYSRTAIIFSKMIAIFINSLILSVTLFISTLLASVIFFEYNNLFTSFQHFNYNNAITMASLSIVSNILLTTFYISLVFLLSVLFKSQMITSMIGYIFIFSSILINFFISEIFSNYMIVQWNPFNLLNFRESVLGSEIVAVGNLSSLHMGLGLIVYIALMFAFTNYKFKKMDIS